MEQSSLMNDGFTLVIYGMGFVFVFLTILVIATSLMSWIITRYEKNVGILPEEGIPAPTAVISQADQNSNNSDSSLMAVLSAAVHKYRSRNK